MAKCSVQILVKSFAGSNRTICPAAYSLGVITEEQEENSKRQVVTLTVTLKFHLIKAAASQHQCEALMCCFLAAGKVKGVNGDEIKVI